jgi:hypothetical protein
MFVLCLSVGTENLPLKWKLLVASAIFIYCAEIPLTWIFKFYTNLALFFSFLCFYLISIILIEIYTRGLCVLVLQCFLKVLYQYSMQNSVNHLRYRSKTLQISRAGFALTRLSCKVAAEWSHVFKKFILPYIQ